MLLCRSCALKSKVLLTKVVRPSLISHVSFCYKSTLPQQLVRNAPSSCQPYLRLLRIDKPIGMQEVRECSFSLIVLRLLLHDLAWHLNLFSQIIFHSRPSFALLGLFVWYECGLSQVSFVKKSFYPQFLLIAVTSTAITFDSF